MKAYFSRINRYSLLTIFLLVLMCSAGGYFLPSPEINVKKAAASNIQVRFDNVRMKFESGEYRNIMDAVARIGSASELERSTSLYSASDFDSMGWKTAMSRLYGAEELQLFVNQESGNPGDVDAASAAQVPFPEITLAGATFSQGGVKAVTVLNIGGAPEIWMWEKKGGKWTTDSITPGYGLQSADISRDRVFFSLYAIQNMKAVREYDMPTSPEAELSKYKGE